MIFEQIVTAGDRCFSYLVGDEKTKTAAVVDPAYSPELVLERAAASGLEVKYLVNTHGHGDHTNGNDHILANTSAELLAWGNGVDEDGQVFELGDVALKFIHTPGHTEDGVCILVTAPGETPRLCTGDTLFVGKVGGTGLGDDARQEYEALHEGVMTLPGETEVWPGHDYGTSPTSTIANEIATNPFLLRDSLEGFIDLKRNWDAYKKEHVIK